MEYILQAVSANGIALVLLMSLLLNFRKKYNSGRREYKIFTLMLIVNMAQCFVEPAALILDGKMFTGSILIAKVLNCVLFINNIIFAFLWSMYAGEKTRKRYIGSFKDILQIVPVLFVIVCSFLNLFTPIFFEITAENVYVRCGIYPVAYLITYLYLIYGIVLVYRYKKTLGDYVFLPVFTFLFPVFLASIVQFVFPGISVLWAGSAIGLGSAYMSLIDERSSIDSLSGLFSRHYLNRYLNALSVKSSSSKRVAGIMLDVNNFKSINDNYGHLVGDDAITSVGKILRDVVGLDGMVFRYAGDEFVVIKLVSGEAEIIELINSIHKEADRFNEEEGKPYSIKFSVGYTTYIPGERSRTFVERMDSEMYRSKRDVQPHLEEPEVSAEPEIVGDDELSKAGMDTAELLERVMNKKELVRVFVAKFLNDETYANLVSSIEQKDMKKAEGDSHTLKGMCGNLSLKKLFKLFTEQVRLIRVGDFDKACEMMPEITETYENTVSHLKIWLERQ